jgi:hypothetical protein
VPSAHAALQISAYHSSYCRCRNFGPAGMWLTPHGHAENADLTTLDATQLTNASGRVLVTDNAVLNIATTQLASTYPLLLLFLSLGVPCNTIVNSACPVWSRTSQVQHRSRGWLFAHARTSAPCVRPYVLAQVLAHVLAQSKGRQISRATCSTAATAAAVAAPAATTALGSSSSSSSFN